MKISRFIPLVLILASLIVGGIYLRRSHELPLNEVTIDGKLTQAGHFFIPAAGGSRTIECLLKRQPEWESSWKTELSRCALGDGWLPPNLWGSRTWGRRAHFSINLDAPTPRALAIRFSAAEEIPGKTPQSFKLVVNGQDLGIQGASRGWENVRIPIAAKLLRSGKNEFVLEFAHRASRRQAGISKDSRSMSANVSRLALVPMNGDDGRPEPSSNRHNRWNQNQRLYFLRQPGTLVLPLLIPRHATKIVFGMRLSRIDGASVPRVRLSAEDLDSESSHSTSVKHFAESDQTRVELPVADLAGSWALVKIEVDIEIGYLTISPPEFMGRIEPPADLPEPTSLAATDQRPDVILITLDAARADHFSFAGHHRPTTPFIDAFAADSIVFPHAYALAPYTLCSVPTMITGLSFFDHGVVGHGDVLSKEPVTLAESLRSEGYHTACFSATPNNSRSKGFDQGYEVFRETWKDDAPQNESRRAHYMAARVIEWLDTVAEDPRPLHLQVHMIPPHAPYDPPPEFDIFTDPAYDGPCDGYPRTRRIIDGRERRSTAKCIEHLLNLYDGNLRTADDAVRLMVESLSRRPRWSNTVVLITSDHGEAFWEHRRLGHNSTLFREMLHVPFILRMPSGFDRSIIETDHLVTLADITPTLLGAAGISPAPSGPTAVDLLAPHRRKTGRFLIARTTDGPPILGLRTLRWSMTLNSAGSGEFYDLLADPNELDNIHFDQAARFAGMANILTWRMERPVQLLADEPREEIGDDERALLETLGYLTD